METFLLKNRHDIPMLLAKLQCLDFTRPWRLKLTTTDKRSLDQNAAMWAMLTDVSHQVEWYGNRLTAEEWKSVFTAGLKRYKVVPGIDGGFVAIGMSTSSMSRQEFGELLDFIQAFGDEKGVKWSAPKWVEAA